MLCGPYCLYFLTERPRSPSMLSVITSACFPFRTLPRGEDASMSKEQLKSYFGLNDAYVFSYLANMVNRFVHCYA